MGWTFQCLLGERTLRYQPAKVFQIINVCCALFNICIEKELELVDAAIQPEETVHEGEEDDESANNIRPTILNNILN